MKQPAPAGGDHLVMWSIRRAALILGRALLIALTITAPVLIGFAAVVLIFG